jgi:hypothetical protein
MPPLKELLALATDAVKRLTNQTLLFAIALFAIAIGAMLILLTEPTVPWWVRASVAVFLCVFVSVLALAAVVQRKRMQRNSSTAAGPTLGAIKDQLRDNLREKQDDELERVRQGLAIDPFPDDCDTNQKMVNYLVDHYPVARLAIAKEDSRRLLVTLLITFTVVLLLVPVGLWLRSLPSTQERAIRAYYDGINMGLTGDQRGWVQAWDVLSSQRQASMQQIAPGTYPATLSSLYDSHHRVHFITFRDRTPSAELYVVYYETREVVFPSSLHRWMKPATSAPVGEFYTQLSDRQALVATVMSDLLQYYQLKSTKPQYSQMNQDALLRAIQDYVSEVANMEQLFQPNVLKVLAQLYGLVRHDISVGQHPQAGMRHYDVSWIYDLELRRESAAWKIDKFVRRAAVFKEVNPE